MDYTKLHLMNPDELRTLLEGESCGVEETSYHKPLNDTELADKRQEFTQAAIEKAMIDDEFKIEKDKYKEKLAPIQSRLTEALDAVKTRGVMTKGKCHKLPDYDNRLIYIVDDEGHFISSRMMKPEERQLLISHNTRTERTTFSTSEENLNQKSA